MTEQQQRIALAEWAGYKWLRVLDAECSDPECWTLQNDHFQSGSLSPGTPLQVLFEVVDKLPTDAKRWRLRIPDYLHDLNAVWHLEEKLTITQWPFYLRNIVPAESNWRPESDDIPNAFSLICHATAAQRCEALLRTLGLWKEGE